MTKREIPAPFYAAAGASDLAYRRLRKVPETATATLKAASQAAATLRERVATGESRLNRDRLAADVAKLRESAQRNAAVAQERAVTGYRRLVAHGEHVVANRIDETGEPTPDSALASEPAADAAPVQITDTPQAGGDTTNPTTGTS